jgi:hypothetical protein
MVNLANKVVAVKFPEPKPAGTAEKRQQTPGVSPLDARVDAEGKAILKSEGFRTKRPNRPQRSRGHGIQHLLLEDVGAKLVDKDKKPYVRKISVKPVAIPEFMRLSLLKRSECDYLKERSEGQSIVTRYFG